MPLRLLILALAAFSASAQTFGPFEVFPSVAVKDVTQRIRLRAEDGFDCRNEPVWCGVTAVTIGGVPSPSFAPTELFAEWEAVIPDLGPGIYDVVVTDKSGNMRRHPAALRIVGATEPYSAETFDRLLIPVIYEGSGQNGSRWTTDVWAMNGGRYEIAFHGGPFAELDRDAVRRVATPAPRGLVLYPAKDAQDDLAFNVLVRDLSRQAEAFGTELPVVRERDFRNRRVILMNLPAEPHYRLTLRIYALDRIPINDTMNYWLHTLEGGEQAAFGTVALEPPAGEHEPWSATVDLMSRHPEIVGRGPLRLSLLPLRPDPKARFWAFVSVTNNDTQHVTAITPNP